MEWSQAEVQQTLVEIKRRAAVDPEFRALLLHDPKAAMGQVSPKPLPENFKIRFVENAGAHMTVVLPDPVAATDGELNEAELALVSGGGGFLTLKGASLLQVNLSTQGLTGLSTLGADTPVSGTRSDTPVSGTTKILV